VGVSGRKAAGPGFPLLLKGNRHSGAPERRLPFNTASIPNAFQTEAFFAGMLNEWS
jgi:hypothetical protein